MSYDAVSSYADVIAYVYTADNFRSAPYEDIIAYGGSTLMFAACEGIRAYSYLMKDCAVRADFCASRDEDAVYAMREGGQAVNLCLKRNECAILCHTSLIKNIIDAS